ncbi:MAG: GntR family transcriptional regulator [Peptococcaceae bacterium]|nr:GntR family transcriptional regulator [Peptococcaceae bacterium]
MKTRESFIPAYFQLAEDIREQILSGRLKPGDPLPTEIQLGAKYGISKMTVRNGLKLLVDEGLIESYRGRGSFVSLPKLNELVLELSDSSFQISEKSTVKLLGVNIIPADDTVASILQLKPGSKVLCFNRLFIINDDPVAVEFRYITYHRGQPVIEQEINYAAFPEVVANHTGLVSERNQVTISAIPLPPKEAELLGVPGGIPALKIEQLVYGGQGKPLGLSIMTCHGEKYRLLASTKKFF